MTQRQLQHHSTIANATSSSLWQRPRANDSQQHALSLVNRTLSTSQGRPLENSLRAQMEPKLGADFSGLRVHTTAASARTLGNSIDATEHHADRIATSPINALQSGAAQPARACDLSGVRIHTDAAAAASARALDTRAYTVGNNIVFGAGQYSPSTAMGQKVLTHELAHVAQHSRAGDTSTVRRFTEFSADDQSTGVSRGWHHPKGTDLRVSDDGQLASEDNGWGAGLSKRAWTLPEKVEASNKILGAQGSVAKLRLKPGGQSITGDAPDTGAKMNLQEVEPIKSKGNPDEGTAGGVIGGITGGVLGGAGGAAAGFGIASAINSNSRDGKIAGAVIGGILGLVGGAIGGAYAGSAIERHMRKLKLTPDCGTAAREVTGSQPAGKRDVCVIRDTGGGSEETLTPRGYHGGNPTTPEEMSEEIFKKEFGSGLTRQEAYARYAALSDADRDAFDKKYGINKYAVPHVGEAATISTEKDMPGFTSASDFTWNFHFAATVLESGRDYITLESAAGWGARDWIFFMYGPETKGQSFHEFQKGTLTHGTKAQTMVVRPEP